ncbi:unnamed protein product [Owenia fusiformis]|uniref:Protein-serine/threonine phosphatase n=1 Tax=Owenia fusiformis TaxID=6347 RepID=A0A8J1T837_OWEFU|nr:unnamed protein product [Owenia fusiformis]
MEVKGVKSCELWCMLRDSDLEDNKRILVLDCRSFLCFNIGHVKFSHNIHIPPILKRRSGGTTSLSNVITCKNTRNLLLKGDFFESVVLIDDDNVENIEQLDPKTNIALVLKSLQDSTELKEVFVLLDGYKTFSAEWPQMCIRSSEADPRLTHSLSLPSSKTPLTRQEKVYASLTNQGQPAEILPWLYLGSAYHSAQKQQLLDFGITAILNVSNTISPKYPESFDYHRVPVDDTANANIKGWFPEAIKFIEEVRSNAGRVLVHCQAGISRSATVCIAYIMQTKQHVLEEAFDYVRSCRNVINPNLNFMRQLMEFEQELFKADLQDIPMLAVHSPTLKLDATITHTEIVQTNGHCSSPFLLPGSPDSALKTLSAPMSCPLPKSTSHFSFDFGSLISDQRGSGPFCGVFSSPIQSFMSSPLISPS